jgi:hypothetical protein
MNGSYPTVNFFFFNGVFHDISRIFTLKLEHEALAQIGAYTLMKESRPSVI